MKTIITILFMMAALPMSAIKYSPGEPWPENGYDLSSYAMHLKVSVQRFQDNDTLYYLKMTPYAMKKYDGYYFMTINKQAADSIITNTLTDEKFKKLRHRDRWFQNLMKNLGAEIIYRSLNSGIGNYYEKQVNNTEWSYYKNNQKLNTKTALQAYETQRNPQKTEFSPEAWGHFLRQASFALKIMGAGADTRTLYDKIMQDGGY